MPRTDGSTISKDDYVRRLDRIELQVRGIRRMIDEGSYHVDVLTQVSSVKRALQAVAVGVLDDHVRHCVKDAVDQGDEARLETMVTETTRAIQRLANA